MAKTYVVQFGSGDPSVFTGLSPTFTVFNVVPGGGATTPPGITEIPTATGLYYFSYAPNSPLAFVIDGGSSLSATNRYIVNALDPIQAIDERIGTTSSSFGSTSVDPGTLYGFLKRMQEFNEGNSVFTKSSGTWDIYARGNAVGTSTMLTEKILTDTTSVVTKS